MTTVASPLTPMPCPVVVLLGAGASYDAGLPLSLTLTEKLMDEIQAPDDLGLRRALGLIMGSIALRQGADGKPISSLIDIESVLRIAHMLQDRVRHPLSGFVASWHTALEELAPNGNGVIFRSLISRARRLLSEALKTPEEPTRVKYLAGLWRLTNPWREKGPVAPPSVFTLNYDRCVEQALDYEGYPFTTGFLDGIWEPAQFHRTDSLRLYKLHGSFGWVRHPHRAVLYDRDAALARDDFDIVSDDTPDELIFALEHKLQGVQPFLWMVHRFSESIAAARYIVTVGYGYGDDYINQLIGHGMASDSSKRLLVVDPKLDRTGWENKGLPYYPERTHFVNMGAKKALLDEDAVMLALMRLEREMREEAPFS